MPTFRISFPLRCYSLLANSRITAGGTVCMLLGLSACLEPAKAQTCVNNIPHIQGVWRTLPYLAPINPIAVNLLNTGKVLLVAGSENDADNNFPGAETYRNAIWDPTGMTQGSITVQNSTYDVFCSGTAALPDGRFLIVGGTSAYQIGADDWGDNRASIFDPATRQLVQSQSMADGRWYATATTLGDGRIMVFSGITLTGAANTTVEIYDLKNAGTGWTSPVAAPFGPPLYPRLFLLPNGKVFYSGQGSGWFSGNSWFFDPVNTTWTISVATTGNRSYGSAVLLPLLPPSYSPKVMSFGGGPNPAMRSTEIIDLSAASPAWTPGPDMSTGRIQMNATILPNGKILASGGSVNNESPDQPGKQADLFDPVTQSFSSGGAASYSRLYHSTTLLLPDATVVSMGSNPGDAGQYEPAIEIYTPPYLFDANNRPITTNRPVITAISATVIGYNTPFSVTYSSTSPISSAVLMRPGSVTHSFDMEQRLIGLCGPAPQPACSGAGTLSLTSPPNGNIAPPGYYMLFLLDSAGVPSVAKFIQLSPYATSPPRGTISFPASDTTITAGGSLSFGTTTTAAQYSWVFPSGWPATSTAQNPGNVVFNTPGTYSVSLTVIDTSGNSDPSPPTRIITVLPASGDFSMTMTPTSRAVIPGQLATFDVIITPVNGFSGTVSLTAESQSGFPSGVFSWGFNPPTITGGGTSTLTMSTTADAAPYALSLTVVGNSGSLWHGASTTLLINLAPPTSLTATANPGQISLSWQPSVSATSYHVRRGLVIGGPYESLACTTSTSYTDATTVAGTPYYYVVSAAYRAGPNAGGESADSTEATATDAGGSSGTPPPSAPTNLSASTGNAPRSIRLAWTQSPTPDITQNYVYRRTSTGAYPSTPAAKINPAATYLDNKLTSGASYCFVVTAVKNGTESTKSQPEACAIAK